MRRATAETLAVGLMLVGILAIGALAFAGIVLAIEAWA